MARLGLALSGGDAGVGEAKAINAKAKMIQEYNASVAPKSTSKPSPPSMPSPAVDKVSPGGKYGDRGKEKRIDVKDMIKPLGSFKKGGKVKKTGVYQLHAGEQVVPKEKVGNLAKALAKSK